MQYSKILGLNLPEDSDPSAVGPLNENFEGLEVASATIDHLARIYGYSVAVSTADDSTTTTLTVASTAPVTASRKTVETVGKSSTTYVVTVTIDDETHTMTHTFGATTASGTSTDGGGDVLPFEVLVGKMDRLQQSVQDTLDTTIADIEDELEAQGKRLSDWWVYLKENYNYTCDMPADTSTKPYSYIETAKEGETVKGTLVTTMNADGTYTEVYTIGEATRTRTWSKVDNQWKGVWS